MPLPLVSAQTGFSFAAWFQNSNWFLKPTMAFGLILLALGFGWLIYRSSIERKNEVVNNPNNREEKIQIPDAA